MDSKKEYEITSRMQHIIQERKNMIEGLMTNKLLVPYKEGIFTKKSFFVSDDGNDDNASLYECFSKIITKAKKITMRTMTRVLLLLLLLMLETRKMKRENKSKYI